jgi:hypothetical protein
LLKNQVLGLGNIMGVFIHSACASPICTPHDWHCNSMTASYQCIISGACAYDKAYDIKGMVVATFELEQISSANEHRAQAGRRWLRLKAQGRRASPPPIFVGVGPAG